MVVQGRARVKERRPELCWFHGVVIFLIPCQHPLTPVLVPYDQVGSLRVVADQSGNVIKEILCDSFGGIIEDTNPALRIPIGFAGGLHDRDLGFADARRVRAMDGPNHYD